MKIWFPVIAGGSGTDVFTRRLANALARRNIATELTWFPRHYEFFPRLLRGVSPPSGTTHIHANSWNGFAFAKRDVPLVITEHQGGYVTARPYNSHAQKLYHTLWVQRYVKQSVRAAAAVTAVSNFARDALVALTGRTDVETIFNCVDTDLFAPQPDTAVTAARPFRLLFMGNSTWMKGADLLPEVMRTLGARATLYYTSGLKGRALSQATSNMVPLGRLSNDDEIRLAYRNCDAVIVPSRFEGFGLVALEAMACAKPVIATRIAGIPEVVDDTVTGLLCGRGDVACFVAACNELRQNTEKRNALGRAGRARAETMFSENRIVEQYIALYRRLHERAH